MTALVMFMGLLIGAVLQPQLPAPVWLGEAKVPLLFAVVAYYALQRERTVMVIAACAAGFLQDALSPIPLGISVCAFCACGWIISRYRRLMLVDSLLTQVFIGVTASFTAALLTYLLLIKDAHVQLPFARALLKLVGTGLLGAVAVPVMFRILNRLDRTVGNVQLAAEVEGPMDDFDAATE